MSAIATDSRDMKTFSPARSWWALALLVALIVMSTVDRIILAMLVRPLGADLGISLLQLGLLFGTAFALLYGVLGIPLARIADRYNRRRLILAGVTLWGLCTLCSGFATSFTHLVLLRAGLAIGEACMTPTAHSMVHDLFPAPHRPLAASMLVAAAYAGAAITYIGGGYFIQHVEGLAMQGLTHGFRPWQIVFISVGVLTLLTGGLFAATVREPHRKNAAQAASAHGIREALGSRWPLFACLILSGGIIQMAGYAYSAWAPELMMRNFGFSLADAGMSFGLITLVGSIIGVILLPLVTFRIVDGGRPRAVAEMPLLATAVGIPAYALAPLQDSAFAMQALLLLGGLLLAGATSICMVAMQRLAPPQIRATLIAMLLLGGALFGFAVAPPLAVFLGGLTGTEGVRLDLGLALTAAITGALCLPLLWGAKVWLGKETTPAPTHVALS